MNQLFDVAVIGGGINGCGIAADAAMRGLSVILAEKDDLASKTSSSSTKLIHGGLRYLEYYNFSLVKKALDERQLLLELAPHLVSPLAMVLPYQPSMRPAWLLRSGLFLYDHLSRKNRLPKSRFIRRPFQSHYFSPLVNEINKGFLFYDCTADDARLTLANALQAREHGAHIYPQTKLTGASAVDGMWYLRLKTGRNPEYVVKARSLVNATGPWVETLNQLLQIPSQHALSLIKGSHLVVRQLYKGNHAYLLQNPDNRIVFVIPYHGYSMIGTTDVNFSGDLDNVSIDRDEIDYLLKAVGNYFKRPLRSEEIINTWSGVRPLLAKADKLPQALNRDYVYQFTDKPAPAIVVYGGKITTYRQLACEVIDSLRAVFPSLNRSLSNRMPLPGAVSATGQFFAEYILEAQTCYSWLDTDILTRLLNIYGTRTEMILQTCKQTSDLGQDFGQGLFQQEVDYLINEEWARNSEDILWRRTRLGLEFEDVGRLEKYMQGQGAVL